MKPNAETRHRTIPLGLPERARYNSVWKSTAAIHDRVAYWTEDVLAYFDALGQDAAPDDVARPINTPEALKDYDPDLHALVNETMAYDDHVDWRFKP